MPAGCAATVIITDGWPAAVAGTGYPYTGSSVRAVVRPSPCYRLSCAPYAQFITALREAAACRYILLERPLGEVAARIAAPQVGEVSQRTLLRWFRHLVATAPRVNTGLARLILELAPGADLMATGQPHRDRHANVRTMFHLGHTLNQVARSLGRRLFGAGLFGFVNLHLLQDSCL